MISLNVPNYLKTNFDNICKFKRFSRTSMLVRLMENFLRYEYKQINEDKKLNNLVKDLQKTNSKSKKVIEPPMIPYSSDNELMDDKFWNDRLNNL